MSKRITYIAPSETTELTGLWKKPPIRLKTHPYNKALPQRTVDEKPYYGPLRSNERASLKRLRDRDTSPEKAEQFRSGTNVPAGPSSINMSWDDFKKTMPSNVLVPDPIYEKVYAIVDHKDMRINELKTKTYRPFLEYVKLSKNGFKNATVSLDNMNNLVCLHPSIIDTRASIQYIVQKRVDRGTKTYLELIFCSTKPLVNFMAFVNLNDNTTTAALENVQVENDAGDGTDNNETSSWLDNLMKTNKNSTIKIIPPPDPNYDEDFADWRKNQEPETLVNPDHADKPTRMWYNDNREPDPWENYFGDRESVTSEYKADFKDWRRDQDTFPVQEPLNPTVNPNRPTEQEHSYLELQTPIRVRTPFKRKENRGIEQVADWSSPLSFTSPQIEHPFIPPSTVLHDRYANRRQRPTEPASEALTQESMLQEPSIEAITKYTIQNDRGLREFISDATQRDDTISEFLSANHPFLDRDIIFRYRESMLRPNAMQEAQDTNENLPNVDEQVNAAVATMVNMFEEGASLRDIRKFMMSIKPESNPSLESIGLMKDKYFREKAIEQRALREFEGKGFLGGSMFGRNDQNATAEKILFNEMVLAFQESGFYVYMASFGKGMSAAEQKEQQKEQQKELADSERQEKSQMNKERRENQEDVGDIVRFQRKLQRENEEDEEENQQKKEQMKKETQTRLDNELEELYARDAQNRGIFDELLRRQEDERRAEELRAIEEERLTNEYEMMVERERLDDELRREDEERVANRREKARARIAKRQEDEEDVQRYTRHRKKHKPRRR